MNTKPDVDHLQIMRRLIIPACICLLLSSGPKSLSQSPGDNKQPSGTKDFVSNVLPLKLSYDKPRTYPVGTKQSLIISDFKCGSDGTVFVPMLDDYGAVLNELHGGPRVDRAHQMLVTALTPAGDVVRFAREGIPGLRNFLPEARYFVSSSRVYTLETADIYDEANPSETLGRAHLILIYDYKGAYQGMIRLEPGLNPINIAAFPSGNIVVVSLDKLNQTTRLLIIDSRGQVENELKLFDEDYTSKLQPADKTSTEDRNQRPWQELALAEWAPFGDDLLLAPHQAQLPLIDMNESGIVRSTTAVLPDGASVGSLLSSDDKIYHVVVGHLESNTSQTNASRASTEPSKIYKDDEIDDINPGDGAVLKRVEFAHGLIPVCVLGDDYTFIAPRDEDGRLQIIRGTVVH